MVMFCVYIKYLSFGIDFIYWHLINLFWISFTVNSSINVLANTILNKNKFESVWKPLTKFIQRQIGHCQLGTLFKMQQHIFLNNQLYKFHCTKISIKLKLLLVYKLGTPRNALGTKPVFKWMIISKILPRKWQTNYVHVFVIVEATKPIDFNEIRHSGPFVQSLGQFLISIIIKSQ